MDVSIIIINYNTCDLTLQCLSSIYEKTEGLSFEIIVVDNASSDESVNLIKEKFPSTILIESNENLGFGRANNLGADYAKGKYLFLLNSDTILLNNIVSYFFDFMESNISVASCGANLLDANGKITIAHGRFPTLFQEFSDIGFKKYYYNYYKQKLSLGQTSEYGSLDNVDYISGADIFIRREIFESFNGFDKDYFMYFEETDLFYRMHKKGFKTCLLPQYSLIHLEGGSFKKEGVNLKRLKMFLTSKFLFYKKNYSWISYKTLKLLSIINVIKNFKPFKSELIKHILNS